MKNSKIYRVFFILLIANNVVAAPLSSCEGRACAANSSSRTLIASNRDVSTTPIIDGLSPTRELIILQQYPPGGDGHNPAFGEKPMIHDVPKVLERVLAGTK